MLKQIIQKNLKLIFAVLFILTAVSSVMMFVPEGITDQLKGMTRWAALLTMVLIGLHYHKITVWIIISMFIGAEIGYDFPAIGDQLNVFSKIFIKLIKCVIAPLIFGTLIVGIAGHSNIRQLGRMGWKSLLYFEVVTTVALGIGLLAINISRAGAGIVQVNNGETLPTGIKQEGWKDLVLHVFPDNLIKSISEGQVLQIVVFTLIFAIAMMFVSKEQRRPFLTFAESLSAIMFRFTDIIMKLAPLAVGGAIAYTVSHLGVEVMRNLMLLLVTLYIALIVFVLLVFVPIILFLRIPVKRFVAHVAEPVSIAFGTASSEAALPLAMENMERFGVTREVVSFVLPTGLTFNLDGTTLYLALASVFVAQAAGIDMSLGQQLVMMLTLMLTSKGVAGVARASLVILAATASSFGLPEWPIAAILGIDALMDMARTAVNTLGNCLATVVIGKWENELKIPAPEVIPE
ncbi:MAG: cation:dicarboxylase symporter family transporter [Saprospiraceae bacterium]|nr:cation:dicarboxylase symporter family transporter [Saprospiraceae bacterium]HMW37809.1 cation:dicarboxylase symporter family transporter [Saprospiraceae bacterium]HMX87495.1 cation:dicarboxylase symporter family transporter [Saprospiraceae bacterium]HMZ39627.1 cation:dicarboxylase symporter family transporter [Saprospiraceae bacterium]HNA63742.1 cation:dicarboxylase symporter family transporter [Saprospiraceae bacterium]